MTDFGKTPPPAGDDPYGNGPYGYPQGSPQGNPYANQPYGQQPSANDPYRYGAPPPPQVQMGRTTPTGKQILTSSWRLLKQDRELIWLPVIGSIFGFVAFAIFFLPGLVIGLSGDGDGRVPMYIFAALGGLVSSVIGIYFQAALVIGAYQRADGHDPTLGGVLAVAWRMKGKILSWAIFTTIVGTVIRAVEQRLGIAGRILGFLAGIAWAVATFFAVPIIVAEGLGPIDALKKSASTIRDIWGTSVRTTLRFGILQFVLMIVPFVLIIAGVALVGSAAGSDGSAGGIAGGIVLAAIGALLLIGIGVVFGAISTYARALIYRWTTGAPVPGIDPALFAGAFAAKRGRR